MGKNISCGQFEQLVLTAILLLREDAYGITIHQKVGELSGPKPVTLGAVYVLIFLRDTPGSMGLPPVEVYKGEETPTQLATSR